jgi:hypothetical protein
MRLSRLALALAPAVLLSASAVLALAPRPAHAADAASLVDEAQRLDALEPFLTRYIGRCTDPFERKACEANSARARRELSGRIFAIRVTDAAMLVQPQRRGDGYVLLVTPFIDGGGLALTHGAPAKQDAQGRPLVSYIPITVELPDGMMEMEFESPFRTGAIELDIAFRPERTWKLSRRGDGLYEGVAARFVALRVLNARTGREIAAKVL